MSPMRGGRQERPVCLDRGARGTAIMLNRCLNAPAGLVHKQQVRTLAVLTGDMYKILLLMAGLAAGWQGQAQPPAHFGYWVSSVDKAARKRTTYHVTEAGIAIKTGPYDFLYFSRDYIKDRPAFTTPLDSAGVSALQAIATSLYTDSLKAVYDNSCIIDGLILSFQFEWGNKIKSSTVSNYYVAALAPCLDFINRHVPYRYNIAYPKTVLENLRKRCPPDLLVH